MIANFPINIVDHVEILCDKYEAKNKKRKEWKCKEEHKCMSALWRTVEWKKAINGFFVVLEALIILNVCTVHCSLNNRQQCYYCSRSANLISPKYWRLHSEFIAKEHISIFSPLNNQFKFIWIRGKPKLTFSYTIINPRNDFLKKKKTNNQFMVNQSMVNYVQKQLAPL